MYESELRLAVRQATKRKLYRAVQTVSLWSRVQHYLEGSMLAAIVILCGALLPQMPDTEIVTGPVVQVAHYDYYFPFIQPQEPDELVADARLYCMTQNIFWEARDQSTAGQVAVAQITMNRVESPLYPDTVCGVVYQYKQFSWYWDGKSDVPKEEEAWDRAQMIAGGVLAGSGHADLMDENTLHYHAWYVNPRWNRNMQLVAQIGDHIFYGGSGGH